jgi:DNA-binding NarL/FixJ family response regulator
MNTPRLPGPLKVFLVEDSVSVRQRIAASLRMIDGVSVVGEAEDAGMALVAIEASRPDIVIVDLRLADGNGFALLRALARHTPPVVTVVLTNHSGLAFRHACQEAGVDYFFDKTAEFDHARKTIAGIARARTLPAPG